MQTNPDRLAPERPILFKGAMVRAILNGTKNQTRRPLYVLTKNCSRACFDRRYTPPRGLPDLGKMWTLSQWLKAKPGDLLWVRESWMPDPTADGTWNYTSWAGCREGQIAAVPERFRHPRFCNYAASWPHDSPLRWTPSIHMPRWASRITREIVSVRVERLQDISEADAQAEGLLALSEGDDRTWTVDANPASEHVTARETYAWLWEQINGPDSWDANPWVLRIEFKPTEVSA